MILISLKHVENIGCLAATRRPIALGLPPSGPCLGPRHGSFAKGPWLSRLPPRLPSPVHDLLEVAPDVLWPSSGWWVVPRSVPGITGRCFESNMQYHLFLEDTNIPAANLLDTLASWCGYLFIGTAFAKNVAAPNPKQWSSDIIFPLITRENMGKQHRSPNHPMPTP